MIRILAPHPNTTADSIKQALFVLYPFALEGNSSSPWRHFKKYLVEYRANVRSNAYMLEQAQNFINNYAPQARCDLLIKSLEQLDPSIDTTIFSTIYTPEKISTFLPGQYDTIVILYPDAIGMGWDEAEKILRALQGKQYIIINGRRRIFFWDKEGQKTLSFHRWLSVSWILEFFLTPFLYVAATFLVIIDSINNRAKSVNVGE